MKSFLTVSRKTSKVMNQMAHARSLVRRTGLTNIAFHEADFVSLPENNDALLPDPAA